MDYLVDFDIKVPKGTPQTELKERILAGTRAPSAGIVRVSFGVVVCHDASNREKQVNFQGRSPRRDSPSLPVPRTGPRSTAFRAQRGRYRTS